MAEVEEALADEEVEEDRDDEGDQEVGPSQDLKEDQEHVVQGVQDCDDCPTDYLEGYVELQEEGNEVMESARCPAKG